MKPNFIVFIILYFGLKFSEVLRLWPPVIGLMRECVKDYNIGRANDEATRDYIVSTHGVVFTFELKYPENFQKKTLKQNRLSGS